MARERILRGGQEIGELDRLVAGHAGDRRLAGDIALREGVDDRLAEALLIVEHVMRNAQRFGNATGVVYVLSGAARTGAMGGRAVVVELQRHADDVIAFALQDAGDHRRVDAARHGDDDAGFFGAAGKIEAVHGAFTVRRSMPMAGI